MAQIVANQIKGRLGIHFIQEEKGGFNIEKQINLPYYYGEV